MIEKFVDENSDAFGFLASDKAVRSNTSVCMTVNMDGAKLKEMVAWLSAENIAHDIGAYRDAPDGMCNALHVFVCVVRSHTLFLWKSQRFSFLCVQVFASGAARPWRHPTSSC